MSDQNKTPNTTSGKIHEIVTVTTYPFLLYVDKHLRGCYARLWDAFEAMDEKDSTQTYKIYKEVYFFHKETIERKLWPVFGVECVTPDDPENLFIPNREDLVRNSDIKVLGPEKFEEKIISRNCSYESLDLKNPVALEQRKFPKFPDSDEEE